MDRQRHALRVMVAVLALGSEASAQEQAHDDVLPETMADVRKDGLLITDGKGHYIAFQSADPLTGNKDHRSVMFYGDGKVFHRVRIKGLMSKKGYMVWSILDERLGFELERSMLTLRDKAYTMTCREPTGTTALTVVPAAEARALLAKATFTTPGMERDAYAIARDGTTYYYVDRAIRPIDNTDFRFYVGKRGAMKLQKLKSLANDDGGTVFTTKTGSLRVTLRPTLISWTAKKKTVTLTPIPIETNVELVFSELGVYAGKKFGVPCDDM